MKVYWTARAETRLDAIHAYIAQENPAAALRIAQRILQRSWQITEFSQSGRRVPDYARDDVRELIEGNYRIVPVTGHLGAADRPLHRWILVLAGVRNCPWHISKRKSGCG